MLNSPRRKPLIVAQTFITVPVSRAVEVAIFEWIGDHLTDLERRLEPLSLVPEDLALPEWHRLVYADEIESTVQDHESRADYSDVRPRDRTAQPSTNTFGGIRERADEMEKQ